VARVETVEKGHGRIEIRRLECSESLASYLSQWPGLRQVCRIERRRSLPGKDSIEVVHAITSLSRERADAASLLNIARGHWGIENRLHHVRDRTCREDACRTRSGNAPQTLPPCETPPSPSIDAGGTVLSRARSTSPNIATRRSPSSNKREPNDPAVTGNPVGLTDSSLGCVRSRTPHDALDGRTSAERPSSACRPHPCSSHRC